MIYKEAAKILGEVADKKGSLKSLVFGSSVENKKQLFALVCETLKFTSVVDTIIDNTHLLKLERKLEPRSLAQVLVYDFLLGKGIGGASKNLKERILKHKAALKSELARLKVKAKVTCNQDLIKNTGNSDVELPRYVRVNRLKTTLNDVVQHFRKEGFTQLQQTFWDYSSFLLVVGQLEARQFLCDPHVPDLLVFAPKTDLHNHVLYTTGDIILQDKASCIPAAVLQPPPGSHVIDACAAPGNKTTHAAALMNNKGKIYAFDLDAKRLATMRTLCLKAGALCIDTIHKDFLKTDPMDTKFANVQYFIVDPSCSGSGIVSRMDHLSDEKQTKGPERLKSLANFQATVLKHALSFPAAKRVVYSTCSIHKEENEMVVKEVYEHCKNNFKLVKVMPEVSSRGESLFSEADCCLRLNPVTDCTNGFFVACFEKREHLEGDIVSMLPSISPDMCSSKVEVSCVISKNLSSFDVEINSRHKEEDSAEANRVIAKCLKKKKTKKNKNLSNTDLANTTNIDMRNNTSIDEPKSSNGSRKRKSPVQVQVADTATENKTLKVDENEVVSSVLKQQSDGLHTSKKKKKNKKKKHSAVTS